MVDRLKLAMMTWVEAREKFDPDRVVLLPIGTTEQNGPACPLGVDTYIADYFATEVAKRVDALVLPAVPYGCSRGFQDYPGTIWVEPDTLRLLVRDIARALAHHGTRYLVVVNNHGPNVYPVEQALYQVKRETGLRCIMVWPLQVVHKMAEGSFKDHPCAMGHGGEPMTSVMMAIDPSIVKRHLAPNTAVTLNSRGAFAIQNSSTAMFKGYPVYLDTNVREVSETGQTGDVTSASAERGKVLLDRVVEWGVELVTAFKSLE